MYNLGLIGYPITHSSSKRYFDQKFKTEKINQFSYSLYPMVDLKELNNLIYKKKITGLNITRPHKTSIIKYLDEIDPTAKKINSVNTVFINKENRKIGFNTDLIGFEDIFKSIHPKKKTKALILGNGSVTKTISYFLKIHMIDYLIVSRNPKKGMISYKNITNIIDEYQLIINTTPLGQYPKTSISPDIPYHLISNNYYCIDLIYNPKKSLFLEKCAIQGAKIINGEKMFISQAEMSWKIWNKLIEKYNV